MTPVRRVLVPLVAVALGAGACVGTAPAATAAPVTYSVTVAGTDTHSLDPHIQPQFLDGGGVLAVVTGSYTLALLEANIDLPVGTKVTSIAVTGAACNSG